MEVGGLEVVRGQLPDRTEVTPSHAHNPSLSGTRFGVCRIDEDREATLHGTLHGRLGGSDLSAQRTLHPALNELIEVALTEAHSTPNLDPGDPAFLPQLSQMSLCRSQPSCSFGHVEKVVCGHRTSNPHVLRPR